MSEKRVGTIYHALMEWDSSIPKIVEIAQHIDQALDAAVSVMQPVSPLACTHKWRMVSDVSQGMTQTRVYECPLCSTHSTLVGPAGTTSPFDIEEVTNGDEG